MVFSSSLFLVWFLPIFLLVYNLTPKSLKNWVILFASIFFYSWGAPKFLFILVGSTIIDFYIVKNLYRSDTLKRKRIFLILSLTMNLGLLAYFKYANFFIENVNVALQNIGFESLNWTKIMLPIGISFYTFQTLTYSIDVYRGTHKPLDKLRDYLVYIMSFPQMIAGPIVRFNLIADQITERKETIDDKLQGFYRFCIGLAKKVLIANVMAAQADIYMNQDPSSLSAAAAWIGILAYTFQIYFDFAGYSDMAIGLGKMMGFKFPENFNNPYNARSISEFWRRWHITLGQWMKDYLYIPLGGNKVGSKARLYFNLWFVFLVSGLWHGASWNFVLWGAFHGFFLILDRLFLLKILNKIGTLPSVLFTFFVVVIGWVFFRIEEFDQAIAYLGVMFGNGADFMQINIDYKFYFIFGLATLFAFIRLTKIGQYVENKIYFNTKASLTWYMGMFIMAGLLFIVSLAAITSEGFNPFIYFRF